MAKQQVRRSQFVFTYGPGALLESRNGPRVAPNLITALGDLASIDSFKKLEIGERRLSAAISVELNSTNCRIVELPEVDSKRQPARYATLAFPAWRVCYGSIRQPRGPRRSHNTPILYDVFRTNGKCPICRNVEGSSGSRFVNACTAGHLDDVDWDCAVHLASGNKCEQPPPSKPPCTPQGDLRRKCCKPKYYEWEGKGISLSDIRIRCPDCGRTVSMNEIYDLRFVCPSRLPENEHQSGIDDKGVKYGEATRVYERCDKEMKTIQRQANSLRIADTMTFLTLPTYTDPAWSRIQRVETYEQIAKAIELHRKGKFVGTMREAVIDLVSDEDVKEFIMKQDQDLREFVDRFEGLGAKSCNDTSDFLIEEFDALQREPNPIPCILDVPAGEVEVTVLPIPKVSTVTVQIGYQRHPYPDSKAARVPSSVSFSRSPDRWFPGFRGVGEGLFLTFKPGFDGHAHILKLKAADDWAEEDKKKNLLSNHSIWKDLSETPMFVWWHTLSHFLLRTLSLNSGYSPASIRERVYVNRNATSGGILLYTTSPGQDGSMGGLVENAYSMQPVLDAAIESMKQCSNDPLCQEIRKSPTRPNGSACYSCLLVSETSCEERNRCLDRHMLLGD